MLQNLTYCGEGQLKVFYTWISDQTTVKIKIIKIKVQGVLTKKSTISLILKLLLMSVKNIRDILNTVVIITVLSCMCVCVCMQLCQAEIFFRASTRSGSTTSDSSVEPLSTHEPILPTCGFVNSCYFVSNQQLFLVWGEYSVLLYCM